MTLDKIDGDYIKDILIKCQSILKMRMTNPDVCEKNRDRAKEYTKMTQKAIDILNEKSNRNIKAYNQIYDVLKSRGYDMTSISRL